MQPPKSQLDILCHQVKNFNNQEYLHLLDLVAKGTRENPKIFQAIATAIVCSPETESKTLLLNTMLSYLIENGEVEMVLNQKLQPYWLAFMVLNSLCRY